MAMFDRRLEQLLGLVKTGAVEPAAGMDTLWGLQDQRRENRQARKASMMEQQQGSLDSLASLALGAAGTPGSMEEALATFQGSQSILGGNVPQGLEQLAPLAGESTGMWDTSPLIDVADRRQITTDAQQMLQGGKSVNDVRARIHEGMRTAYGPDYEKVAESIDALIRQAVGG